MKEKLLKSEIEKGLKTSVLGKELLVLSECASTNLEAKKLAEGGAKEGAAVIALSQTNGRGRMGRSFFSPRDKGIYMSVVLRPNKTAQNSVLITSFAAVAVARAISEVCKASPKIKWVNDVYLNGKKVCGILTEALLDFESQTPKYIVLGIGINVKKTVFPPSLFEIATSIENETKKEVDRNALAAAVLNELDALYKDFENGGFLSESRALSMLIGKEITVIRGNESYLAVAEDIDRGGGLVISRDGKKEVLTSGEVSVRVKNENS